MNTELRKDCPMRHENGNCTVAGGFCTAVNDAICEALHNAYDCGKRSLTFDDFVPHAYWILNDYGKGTCSNCHFTQANVWDYDHYQNYCGVCGAKMSLEENDETD